ncbi:MAG: YoaK family protein [Labilithrix sp.]
MAPTLHENNIFGPRFIAGWVFFTAAAGFVNAAALMAGNNVVSHVTGSVTAFATDPSIALRIGLVVGAFVLGGVLSVLAKETLSSWMAYVIPPAAASLVLVAIGALGRAGFFGEFGGDNDVKGHAFPMLALLAIAMGMLNAAVGAATANRIRVTHLTGPLTDLAGHIVRGETSWAALRLAKLAAFVGGAALAAKLSRSLEFEMFGVGAALLVIAVALTGVPARSDELADASAHAQ